MKSRIGLLSLLALTLAAPVWSADMVTSARRQAYEMRHGVPAPPTIVFRSQPRWVQVPQSRVYVVDRYERPAYDMFRFGGFYFIYSDGYWYRSRRYNGPFVFVEENYVPRPIYLVPASEWRSPPRGLPPGIAKKYRDDGWNDNRGRGHGRGNGRGHGGN